MGERGEFLSYNYTFLASISNTVLKGSGKENYSNIHYVKMTAVELLNFSADKFTFSPFLAVVALTNVTRAPVNVFCNAGVNIRLLSLYNCCIKPETEENHEIILFWLSSSSNPSNLDHFVPLMNESFVSQRSEGSFSKSQPIDCARSISFPAGGISGKKTLLKQSKISSKYDDHCDNVSVSKQECIVDPSSQVSDSSIKQESVTEVQTPNLVMEPLTCSLDIMNDLDNFARYIENGSKISASEKSNVIANKWIPEDFVFPKDHNKLCFKPFARHING